MDLFFMLSGYILAMNYGDRMGVTFTRRSVAVFWWARLARIWPAYMAMLLFTAIWHGIFVATASPDPVAPREYSVLSFFRQALLIVQWTEPDFERLTWNGAAWSVSAEAFAYLLFPVIALLIYRMGHALSRRALMGLAFGALLPVVLFSATLGLYAPFMWVVRILGEFMAGAVLYYALAKVSDSKRTEKLAQGVTWAAVVIFFALAVAIELIGRPQAGALLIPVLLVLIGGLALSQGGLSRLLANRVMVLGGMISYSVYLVHMPLIEIFWWLQQKVGLLAPGTIGSKLGFLLIPVVVVACGYVLWRYLEEPSRRAMRRMSLAHVPERAVNDAPMTRI
ncbi:acyltransferase [Mycetocola zhadangensis]|nr:acyltransferase [Mycetocola zhadangensis]